MLEYFLNNGLLSEGESLDGARFSSAVSAVSLSEGEAACYGTVSVPGVFVPLKFGGKEPRWRVAPTDSNDRLIRSALPSVPSVEAAAGDGEFMVTSPNVLVLDLDFHDKGDKAEHKKFYYDLRALTTELTGAERVFASRTGSGGVHVTLFVPDEVYEAYPLVEFALGRGNGANNASRTVGGRAWQVFAASVLGDAGAGLMGRVDVIAGGKKVGARADGARKLPKDALPDDDRYSVIVPDHVFCGVSEADALDAYDAYHELYRAGDADAAVEAVRGVFPPVGSLSMDAARRLSECVERELNAPELKKLTKADNELVVASPRLFDALPQRVRALVASGSRELTAYGLPAVDDSVLNGGTVRAMGVANALVEDGVVDSFNDGVVLVESARFAVCEGSVNPLVWGPWAGKLSPVQCGALVRSALCERGALPAWGAARGLMDPAVVALSDEALDGVALPDGVADSGFPALGAQREADVESGLDNAGRVAVLADSCVEKVKAERRSNKDSYKSFKSCRSLVAARGVGAVDALSLVDAARRAGWFNDTSGRDVFTLGVKWATMIGRVQNACRNGVDFERSWGFVTRTFAEVMADGSLPFEDHVLWAMRRRSGVRVEYSSADVEAAHRLLAEAARERESNGGGERVFGGDPARVWSADRVMAGRAALMARLVPGGVRVEGCQGILVAALGEGGGADGGSRVVPVRFLSPDVVEAVFGRLMRAGDNAAAYLVLFEWAGACCRVLSRAFKSSVNSGGSAGSAASADSSDSAGEDGRIEADRLARKARDGFAALGSRGPQGALMVSEAIRAVVEEAEAQLRGEREGRGQSRTVTTRAMRDAVAFLSQLWGLSAQGATARLSGSRKRLRRWLRRALGVEAEGLSAQQLNERVKNMMRLLRDARVLQLAALQRAPRRGEAGRASVYSIDPRFLSVGAGTVRALGALRGLVVAPVSTKFTEGCALDMRLGDGDMVLVDGRTLDEWDTLGGSWLDMVPGRASKSRVALPGRLLSGEDRAALDGLFGGLLGAFGLGGGSGAAAGLFTPDQARRIVSAGLEAASVSGRELFSHQVAVSDLFAMARQGVEGVRVVAGTPTPHMVESGSSKSGASRQVEVVRREVARGAWDGVEPGTSEYAQRTDEVFSNPERTPSHQLKDGGNSAQVRELYVPVVVLVAEGSPLLADERFARVMNQSFPESGERGMVMYAAVSLVDAGGAAAFATSGNRSRKYFEVFAAAVASAIAGGVRSGLELTLGVRSLFSQLCAAHEVVDALDGGYILAGGNGVNEAALAGVSECVAGLSARVLELAAVGFDEARPGLVKFVTDTERERLNGLSEAERAAEAAKRLNGLASVVDSLGEYAPDGVDADEWVARLLAAAVIAWSNSVTSRVARADGSPVCAVLLRVLSGVSAAFAGGGVGAVPEPVGWVLRA
jgi:hypothetical protein